jgi:cytochrome c oxidase subunit II
LAETLHSDQRSPHGEAGERAERMWARSMTAAIVVLLGVIVFTSAQWGLHPPSRVETIDSASLHKGGEFSEANLGTSIATDGSAVVRVVAQQYAFIPSCVVVPSGVPVTMRLASADAVHGFLIQGTNVNAMVVPGYVTTVRTTFQEIGERLMPCHEFCGVGHQAMWAHVRIVDAKQFPFEDAKAKTVSCG